MNRPATVVNIFKLPTLRKIRWIKIFSQCLKKFQEVFLLYSPLVVIGGDVIVDELGTFGIGVEHVVDCSRLVLRADMVGVDDSI